MNEAIESVARIGIVPVLKLESAKRAVPLANALVAGGIPIAEVTFRTEAASDAILAMRAEASEVLVGAGTVTSVALAEKAVAAGARFIVCPAWDEGVVDYCLSSGTPVIPGVSGPDGVARALARGLDAVKFFPAEASGGVAMLDAFEGPFGSMRFIPTGGIDASNIGSYARRRQVLAVGGSWMASPELVEAGDWQRIERLCREAVFALHGFSFAHVGINCSSVDVAGTAAASLASLFGFSSKEGASSIFISDAIELLKSPGPGERGHIAIRCNDAERAAAYLRGMGVDILAGTERRDEGRLNAVYLDLSIGGFAIHLVRA